MSDIQPNLQQLVEELQSIRATWKLFGLFLGIPDDDLEAIDEDKRNVGDKLYVLCYKWLQMKPRGTWNDIVTVLKNIQKLELAERLEKKYIKHHLSSSDTSYGRPELMSISPSHPYESDVTFSPDPIDEHTEITHVDVQTPCRPTFHQLYDEVHHVKAEWERFGLCLGFVPDDLAVIARNKSDVDQSFAAVCDKWLKRNPSGTWEDIIIALEKMERFDLKIELEKKYIKHNLPSSDTSYDRMSTSLSPPYQSAVTSSPGPADDNTKTTHVHVDVPKEFKNDVDDLAVQFTYLLSCIESGLKQKLINNQLNLDQLGRFISDLLSIPYEPLHVTEGRDEIDILFSQFRDYLSFLHTDLLRHIDKQYLNCMLQDEIKKYDDDIDEFMKSTTIIDFKEMIRSKGLDKGIPVILRLNRRWKGCTLDHLHHLTDYLFEDSSSLLKFDEIHHSVLTIKYTVPRSLLLSLRNMASRKVRGMKWAGVLSIQVDTILMTVSTNETCIHPSDALLDAARLNDDQITNDIHLLVNIGGDVNTIGTLQLSTRTREVTPLIMAAIEGSVSSLYALLELQANPDIQTNDGATALLAASHYGHEQCIHLLIQSKADPNIQENKGVTALVMASQKGDHQCVDLLLRSKADPDIQANNGVTALHMASQKGDHQCVDLLLQSKADPDIQTNNGVTALVMASQMGHDQCVDLLLQSKANPDIQTNNGVTALYTASQNGHYQCVDLLLHSKANPDIQTNNGVTALYIASQNGHDQCVDLLLQSKANPDIQNNNSYTALYAASYRGHDQCVALLLQSKASPDIQARNGATALLAASQNGHDRCVDLLLQSKANPDIQDNNFATALYVASQNRHDQCVELLLQSKANPNIPDTFGRTPLLTAIFNKHHQIVNMLLEHNAHPNVDALGLSSLSLACACSGGDLSIVSLLLQHGALVNIPEVISPLSAAVHEGHYDIVKFLINAGADVNVQEEHYYGVTPLIIASARGNLLIVHLLLQSGADVTIQDKEGYTAIDAAKVLQHQEILRVLSLTLLTDKVLEQVQKYLSPSEQSPKSAVVTSPQDDDTSLESQSTDTTPQFNNDGSESVSQQHQDNNERQTQESNQFSLETIRNHFNSMLNSLQTSYKSFAKNTKLMFENEPTFQQPVY